MASVSQSLRAFELWVLDWIFLASVALALASIVFLLALSVSRYVHRQRQLSQQQQEQKFDRLISAIICQRIGVSAQHLPKIKRSQIAPLLRVLTSYFSNIVGNDLAILCKTVEVWDIEGQICRYAHRAHRTPYIQILTILSYLSSPSSLAFIEKSLDTGRSLYSICNHPCAGHNATRLTGCPTLSSLSQPPQAE